MVLYVLYLWSEQSGVRGSFCGFLIFELVWVLYLWSEQSGVRGSFCGFLIFELVWVLFLRIKVNF